MADQKYFTLNTGAKIPAVGMGCWMGSPGKFDLENGLNVSFDAGYRHFDTAALYANEELVGKAIRDSGVPRDQIFVTTKLWNADHSNVEKAFDESLSRLNVGYIDLYLMHWPQSSGDNVSFVDTWKDMEKLLETRKDKVRAIGVSNFSVKTLSELLAHAKVVPANNQIETHPYNQDWDVLELCQKHNIFVTAYTPLGQADSPILKDKDVLAIAEEIGGDVTPAQVVLSWNVQRGVGVLPKSTNPGRARKNIQLVTLTDAQMQRIHDITKDPSRQGRLNYVTYDKQSGTVLGWTKEQMGTFLFNSHRLGKHQVLWRVTREQSDRRLPCLGRPPQCLARHGRPAASRCRGDRTLCRGPFAARPAAHG